MGLENRELLLQRTSAPGFDLRCLPELFLSKHVILPCRSPEKKKSVSNAGKKTVTKPRKSNATKPSPAKRKQKISKLSHWVVLLNSINQHT